MSIADEILDGSPPGPDDQVGDGPLTEVLAAPRTGRMGDAVATLQTEQDAIVRSAHRGITVVEGGPGTGKTVVALHRAAYVLFTFPAVAERGVLVVGPDARFLSYIDRVLPSLGENDAVLVTRAGITGRVPTATEPAEAARLKGRAEMADRIRSLVAARRPALAPIRLPLGSETIEIGAAAVGEAIAAARDLPHNPGREVFKEYLMAESGRVRAAMTAATLEQIDADTAAATGIDLDAAVAADLESLGFGRDSGAPDSANSLRSGRDVYASNGTGSLGFGRDAGAPDGANSLRSGRDVYASNGTGSLGFGRDAGATDGTGPLRSGRDAGATDGTGSLRSGRDAGVTDGSEPLGFDRGGQTPIPELDDAVADDPRLDAAIDRIWPRLTPTDIIGPQTAWTAADLTLLDEAAALIDGPPEVVHGHIVIDEAQELTEMDWRAVLRRCPSRSMTVVGDFAQAGRGSTITSWRQAVGDRFEQHTLTVNYRTTAEILEYNRDLLAEIAPGQRLSRSLRHGEPPQIGPATLDIDADELVAVITPDHLDISGAIPVSACRGLEFDTVLVVAPAEFAKRDLYVAQTRATRRLIIVPTPDALPTRRSARADRP